jgi:hypothetical protein
MAEQLTKSYFRRFVNHNTRDNRRFRRRKHQYNRLLEERVRQVGTGDEKKGLLILLLRIARRYWDRSQGGASDQDRSLQKKYDSEGGQRPATAFRNRERSRCFDSAR